MYSLEKINKCLFLKKNTTYIYLRMTSYPGASECLRLELAGSGLKVTNVMPGVTNTDMWYVVASAHGLSPEKAVEMGKTVLKAEDIAILVWETVCKPER